MDTNDVGQDKAYKDAVEKHDAKSGKYKDATKDVPTDQRLPTSQMPQGTDPSPFKVGPMTGGAGG